MCSRLCVLNTNVKITIFTIFPVSIESYSWLLNKSTMFCQWYSTVLPIKLLEMINSNRNTDFMSVSPFKKRTANGFSGFLRRWVFKGYVHRDGFGLKVMSSDRSLKGDCRADHFYYNLWLYSNIILLKQTLDSSRNVRSRLDFCEMFRLNCISLKCCSVPWPFFY